MESTYPKLALSLLSGILLILLAIIIVTEVEYTWIDYSNFTTWDKYLSFAILAFLLLSIASCIGIFFKKPWAWVGVSSYVLYSIGSYLVSIIDTGVEHSWLVIIPIGLLFVGVILFLFSKKVRNYFPVNPTHLIIAILLPTILTFLFTIDPLTDRSTVNLYYLQVVKEEYHLDQKPFSGATYTNHSNGVLALEGKLSNGLEEGLWKHYDEKGKLNADINYKKGIEYGTARAYFSTGEIMEELNYQNGQLHGNYELWYSPEELKIKGTFHAGEKQGEWKEYDLNTSIVKIETFDQDSLINTNYQE